MENFLLYAASAGFLIAALLYAAGLLWEAKRLEGAAQAALALTGAALVGSAAVRWFAAGRPPFANLYESLVVFAASLVVIFLFAARRFELGAAGPFVCFIGFILLVCASRLDSAIRPLMPALRSSWLVAHVAACFVSYAAFAVAFACSLLCLAAVRRGDSQLRDRMDQAAYRTIAFGFLFLAVGIVSGAVWAETAWGRYWGWDPKETWALISWLIYGFYLHTRACYGWRGARGAWVSVLGFASVIFTYLGVTFLLPGLHSYAAP